MSRIHVACPKCTSEGAWYETDSREDVWLRCLCGFAKVVETRMNDMVITHVDSSNVTLPRRDSKLYDCFAALIGLRQGTTGDITRHINQALTRKNKRSSSDIASQLTVLRYKGLAWVVEERKGAPGGSTWAPTDIALTLMAKGVA